MKAAFQSRRRQRLDNQPCGSFGGLIQKISLVGYPGSSIFKKGLCPANSTGFLSAPSSVFFRHVTLALAVMFFPAALLVPDNEAEAANRYWVAASASNWNSTANWSTTSGGAGGASIPGSADIAIFDASRIGDCALDAIVNVAGISIVAGYTGTITQGAVTVTVGSTAYTQADGTFAGSAASITVNGAFSLSGGTFTSTTGTLTLSGNGGFTQTGGTFAPNNGTVTFTTTSATVDVPGSITFYNLTINKNSGAILTIAAGDTLVTTGVLSLSNGRAATGTLEAQGDVTIGPGWDTSGQTAPLRFTGSANQSLTVNVLNLLHPITIDKTGGSVNAGTTSFTIPGTFDLVNGEFISTTGTLTFSGGSVFTQTGGTFTANNGTVAFTTTASTIDVPGSITFYNLTINKNSGAALTIGAGDTLITTGLLSLTNGAAATGTLEARGDVTVGVGWDPIGQTAPLQFTGSVNQAFAVSAPTFANPITINKTGNGVNAGTTSFTISSAFNLVSGDFTSTTGTLTFSGGSVFTQTGGTFTANNGTVAFTTTASTIDVPGSITFNNLTINKNSGAALTIAAGDTLITTGLLTLTNGAAATGTLEARGDVTVGAGWDAAGQTAPLQFTGSVNQAFAVSAPTFANPLITIDKTGGSVNAGATSFTISGPFNLVNGTFTSTTGSLTLSGAFTQSGGVFNGASGTITVNGAFSLNGGTFTSTTGLLTFSGTGTPFAIGGGAFAPSTGTVRYTGNGPTNITAATYNNLQVMPSGNNRTHTFAAGTLTIGGDFTAGNGTNSNIVVTAAANPTILTVNGNVAISALTTLIANGTNPLTVGGSWSNTGTFTHSSGTVILNGTAQQTLSGTMTGTSAFGTLTITNNSGSDPVTAPSVAFSAGATAATANFTTAATKVRLNAGSTFTFTNINFGPGSGARVQLWSSVPGSHWNLNVTGAQTVLNTDARDSDATGNIINATDPSNLDSGNNLNWNFGAQSCSTAQTGPWNAASTWNAPCNVAGGPTGANAVYINSGHIVSVTANAAASNITMYPNAAGSGNGLAINSGISLAVAGSITLNEPTSATSDLSVNGGNLSAGNLFIRGSSTAGLFATVSIDTGTVTISGSVAFLGTPAQARLNFTGAGTLALGGHLADGGTVTAAAGSTINFNGASPQSGGGYSYAILKANNPAGVTLTGAAAVSTLTIGDVTANSLFDDGGFQVTSSGTFNLISGKFRLGSATVGTSFPAFTTMNLSPGTTVEYAAGVGQPVSELPPYRNLTISGSGEKTLSASLTVNEDLTVNDTGGASTFTLSGDNTLTVNGTLRVTGTGSALVAAPANTLVQIVAGNVAVDIGARIDATGRGCGASESYDYDTTDGTPVLQCRNIGGGVTANFGEGGDSTTDGGGGAGYGGAGGLSGGGITGGSTYGIDLLPFEMGSGGGNGSAPGGAGGGSLRLQVTGTLTLNGIISANGSDGNPDVLGTGGGGGGGSGGAIRINAGTVTGAGSFQSNGGRGGNGTSFGGGGGGGGRIAVFIAASNTYTGTTSCLGGGGGAGPGPGHPGANNPTCKILLAFPASSPDGIIDGNGDNVYGGVGTGAGGTSTQLTTNGSASYSIQVQNDGGVAGSYGVTWTLPGAGWNVTLVDNVTSTVYTKNFVTPSINPGASRAYTLIVKQGSPSPPDGTYNVIMDFLVLNGSGGDSIKALIVKSNQRPDGIIDGSGGNVFGLAGSGAGGQSSRTVTGGVATSYSLFLLNNETSPDTFTLSWNTPSGWTVVVNDGSADRSSGFTTALIPAGGTALYTLVVTPTVTSTLNIIVDIASTTTAYLEDSVTAIAVQYSIPAAPQACLGPDNPPGSGCLLSPSAISPTQIKLYWVDTSNNEDGFRIERAIRVGGACDTDEVYGVIFTLLRDTVGSPGTGQVLGYTDGGLAPLTAYCYRFQAYNPAGNSVYSGAVSISTLPPAEFHVPAAVSDLTVKPGDQTQNSITLSWTAPSDDNAVPGVGQAGSYDLRYATSPIVDGGAGAGQVDFSAATSVPIPAPKLAGSFEEATVSGLTPNTIYYFALKSGNTIGPSAMSNNAYCSGTTTPCGDNPTDGSLAGRTALRTNLNMVSIPLNPNPADPDGVFHDDIGGVPQMWNWNSSGLGMVEGVDGCYDQYPDSSIAPCLDITALVPGKGYFIQGGGNRPVIDVPSLSTAVATANFCTGSSVGTINGYLIPLQLGWNMIGDPFTSLLDFSTVYVRQNGNDATCVTYGTAVSPNNWLGNTIYQFDGVGYSNGQMFYTDPPVLEPWKGYWLWVMNNNVINGNTYELILPTPP